MTGAVTYYEGGSWKACCYICGRTDYKSSRMLKYWQGFYTCPFCWEQRNAQELIRPVVDPQVTAWVQQCGGANCSQEQQGGTRTLDSKINDGISLD